MSEGKRRLAGILAADVVGYSAMVAADEPASLARVRALRTGIIEPAAAAHDGRLFKTMGDGFLLEFASAVQALQCAIAIQTALNAQEGGLRLRIGVHQGEVVPEGDDLFGDGVIIAARLEPLAEHGGIVISSRVKEDASGKMVLDVDDLGEPPLKNITAKIRVFRVRMEHAPGGLAKPELSLPDKPSMAVLAFTNMSGDADQEYFADGISEDIITALASIRWLFVIARNSSFTYKGKAVDIKQVGRELGVRYVLEGSVRRAGNRLRITGQLIEAATGVHVWADRYDRTLDDIFAIQDEITSAVVAAIEPVLAASERERAGRMAPDHLGTWELYHRGMWHFFRYTLDDYRTALRLLAEAEKSDSDSPAVQAGLAICNVLGGWLFAPTERPIWTKAAREYGRIATTLNPRDSMAHASYGFALGMMGNFDDQLRETTLAIALNPNNSWAHGIHAYGLAYSGRPGESLPYFEQAFRLSPVDPLRWLWSHMSATALLLHGDYEASLAAGKDLIRTLPNAIFGYRHCMVALVKLDRMEEAKYHADVIFTRFAYEMTIFLGMGVLGTWWGEWRPEDHAAYTAILAKGGLVLRDSVLVRVNDLG